MDVNGYKGKLLELTLKKRKGTYHSNILDKKNNKLIDLPDTGWTILKPGDGWELTFKCGLSCPPHLAAHVHSDLLSFNLYHLGEEIITETGTSSYKKGMYRDYESVDYSWTNTMTASFRLPKTVNTYDDSKNHIQVWLQEDNGSGTMVWKPLQENSEYTLTPNNITVTKNVTFGGAGVVYLHVRWYPQNSVSYIPPSAVKLGLIRPYTPETYNDGTNNVIIQHDGSIHIRQGTELFDRNSANFNHNYLKSYSLLYLRHQQ